MKNLFRWVVIAILLTLSAGAVSAQGQTANGGGAASQEPKKVSIRWWHLPGMSWLITRKVQRELKLTPEQIEKIREKWEQIQGHSGVMTPEEIAETHLSPEAMRDRFEQGLYEGRAWVTTLLDEDQKRRFDQLVLQDNGLEAINAMGGRHLLFPEVSKRLKITPEQWAKFKEIDIETFKKCDEIKAKADYNRLPPDKMEAVQAKLGPILDSWHKRKWAILTHAQRVVWKAMMGKSFHFPTALIASWTIGNC